MTVAGPVGHIVAVHHCAQRRGNRDGAGLVHGDFDALALAGAFALDQRPQYAGAEMNAGQEIADRGARLGRRPVGVARGVGDAARERGRIVVAVDCAVEDLAVGESYFTVADGGDRAAFDGESDHFRHGEEGEHGGYQAQAIPQE